ncbi:MAG: TlpA family protein disulfide reductase [Crocinitomicaceae bacterium]|nr:TlpA family protein disulfide reductase [Crocinitomicaceae bacterium]
MILSARIILGLLLLLFSFSTFAQQYLPDSLTMETLNGKKINLKDYVTEKRKVTIIIFWVSWSKPNQKEIISINNDYLEEWQTKYDIQLIVVSMDDERTIGRVKEIAEAREWKFDILCNPDNSAFKELGFSTLPYTLLLDAKGNTVYMRAGYVPGDEQVLEAEIKKFLIKE